MNTDSRQILGFSKKGKRFQKIIELLEKNSAMSNYDLCCELNCSEATIRNDLRELDKNGLIHRTHGGATTLKKETLDSFSISTRVNAHAEEKNAIANYIVSSNMIKPGQSVVLDIGSTCYIIAQHLARFDGSLNVATSSLGHANVLMQNPNIRLSLAGGFYFPDIDAFDNNSAINLFSNMYFDYYFLGTNGVSATSGVTCTMQDSENRMPVKRLLTTHSTNVILVCDHTKINKTFFHAICPLSDLSMIITDDACNVEERSGFSTLGIPVVFAPMRFGQEY